MEAQGENRHPSWLQQWACPGGILHLSIKCVWYSFDDMRLQEDKINRYGNPFNYHKRTREGKIIPTWKKETNLFISHKFENWV